MDGKWIWSVRHPVVRLSFGSRSFREPREFAASVTEQLAEIERANGIDTDYETVAGRFRSLLRQLHDRTGRGVAVLIDEYDKPILDSLFAVPPDEEGAFAAIEARANRDVLRGIQAVIKDADAHIRFRFQPRPGPPQTGLAATRRGSPGLPDAAQSSSHRARLSAGWCVAAQQVRFVGESG